MQVIDTHTHYFPPEWVALIEKEGPANGAKVGKDNRGHVTFLMDEQVQKFLPMYMDLDLRLKRMDDAGIDVHVMSLVTPMVYWAPPAFGLKLSQVFNDACSAAHERHPRRLIGMATVPMQAPELAVPELERASRLPGMHGLYLATAINGKNLDDKSFFPVYAKCEALGWPIFLHPINPVAGVDRMGSHYLRNFLGNPYDTGIAAASLMFGGVLDAFPKLEVMLPHAGGTFPGLIGRMEHGAKVRPELKNMAHPPSSYLRRFHCDIVIHDDQLLMNLIRQMGADRIVLGSDYDADMGYAKPVDVIDRLTALSAGERDMILGGNAARLLKLRMS